MKINKFYNPSVFWFLVFICNSFVYTSLYLFKFGNGDAVGGAYYSTIIFGFPAFFCCWFVIVFFRKFFNNLYNSSIYYYSMNLLLSITTYALVIEIFHKPFLIDWFKGELRGYDSFYYPICVFSALLSTIIVMLVNGLFVEGERSDKI